MEPEGTLPVHLGLPLVSILSQMHLVHTFPPYFPKIHSNINIIFPPSSRSSEWALPLTFTNQNIVRMYHLCLSHTCYMPYPSHLPWFDRPNNIWWIVQVMKLPSIHSSPASCYFVPVKSIQSIRTLFWTTLNLCSSVCLTDQVSRLVLET
jgi:hypothetical protein